jgi:hypothetical protein
MYFANRSKVIEREPEREPEFSGLEGDISHNIVGDNDKGIVAPGQRKFQ